MQPNENTAVMLSSRWGNEKTTHSILPQDVAFISTSQPSCDHNCGVILGVSGMGQLELRGVKQKEIETLVKAVKAAKNMAEFCSSEASVQFYNADKLYIDVKNVKTLAETGDNQITLSFENPQLSLKVTMPHICRETLAKAMRKESARPQEVNKQTLFNAAAQRQNELNAAARNNFIKKLSEAQTVQPKSFSQPSLR